VQRTTQHLIDLDADSLAADFGAQRVLRESASPTRAWTHPDGRVARGLHDVRIEREAEARGEADAAQNPQRIVEKRLPRRQRRADQAMLEQIGEALARPILDETRVDVVKERVDRQITSQRVLFRRANDLPISCDQALRRRTTVGMRDSSAYDSERSCTKSSSKPSTLAVAVSRCLD